MIRLNQLLRQSDYEFMTKEIRRLRTRFNAVNERFLKIERKYKTQDPNTERELAFYPMQKRLSRTKGKLWDILIPLEYLEYEANYIKGSIAEILPRGQPPRRFPGQPPRRLPAITPRGPDWTGLPQITKRPFPHG